jgi:hypothetical protein
LNLKKVLRFYFCADDLNYAIDNLIEHIAVSSGKSDKSPVIFSERIIDLVESKKCLSVLWGYLDLVIKKFDEQDIKLLTFYSHLRCGVTNLDDEKRKNIHRAVVKFSRKVPDILKRFEEQISLIEFYYALF